MTFSSLLTFLDEKIGPIPVFWDSLTEEEAYNISFKVFVIAGSGAEQELKESESMISIPSIEKISVNYFFTIPHKERRGGVFPISLSMLFNYDKQMTLFRNFEIIKQCFKEFNQKFPNIFVNDELNEPLLKTEIHKIIYTLEEAFSSQNLRVPQIQIPNDFDFQTLLDSITKNFDMAIFAIITGLKLVIVAKNEEAVKKLIAPLALFAPHRKLIIKTWSENLEFIENELPEPDIVGIPSHLNDELREKDLTNKFTRINLDRKRVFGGLSRSNKFCKLLLEELQQSMVGHKDIVNARINWLLQNANYFGHLSTFEDQKNILTLIQKLNRDTLYLIISILEQTSPAVVELLEKKVGRPQLKGLLSI